MTLTSHRNGAFLLGLFAPALAAILLRRAERLHPLCPVCSASVVHGAPLCGACGVGLGW